MQNSGAVSARKGLARRIFAASAAVVLMVVTLAGWSNEQTAKGGKQANPVQAREQLHLQVHQMLSHLDRIFRKQSTFLSKYSRVDASHESLAMKIGLHDVVTRLAEEIKAPGVCEKRTMIIVKLEALLERLGGRAATVNSTNSLYRKEAENAMAVWLQAESNYRMNEAKNVEAKGEEKYFLHKLVIAEHVLELGKNDYTRVLAVYPTKVAEVTKEKLDIEELILMIKTLKFPKSAKANAEPQVLKYIHSEISSVIDTLGGHETPPELNHIDAQVRHIKAQLEHMSSSAAAIQSQHITTEVQKGGGARSEGWGTAQRQAHDAAVQKALAALDVQDGKIAAIKAAHTRLKDKLTHSTHTSMLSHRPAATTATLLAADMHHYLLTAADMLTSCSHDRLHLLKSGLGAALANLLEVKSSVKTLEMQEVDVGNAIDKSQQQVVAANMERNADAGDEIAASEAYTNEKTEFVAQSDANQRSAFVIKTIIAKFNAYCATLADSQQPSTGSVIASASSAAAAVTSLLKAAQSAAASALVPFAKEY